MARKKRYKEVALKIGLSAVLVVILVFAVWATFFGTKDCELDRSCFNTYLKSCDKARFVGGSEMVFEYTILGKKDAVCQVQVELLQGDFNEEDSAKLEGQVMVCDIPEGVVIAPESDIGECHGILKERLQDLVIERLHTYLVKNIGKINLEVLDIPEAAL